MSLMAVFTDGPFWETRAGCAKQIKLGCADLDSLVAGFLNWVTFCTGLVAS